MKPYVAGLSLFFCLTIISLSQCRYITDEDEEEARVKRQTADMRASELLALKDMLSKLNERGCRSYACGLIDVYNRYIKRSWSDQKIAEIKARLGLENGFDIGHGVLDPYKYGRRKRDLTLNQRSQLKNYFKQRPNLHQEAHH